IPSAAVPCASEPYPSTAWQVLLRPLRLVPASGAVLGSGAVTRDRGLTLFARQLAQGSRLAGELACDHPWAQAAPDRHNHPPRLSELGDIGGGGGGTGGDWADERGGPGPFSK